MISPCQGEEQIPPLSCLRHSGAVSFFRRCCPAWSFPFGESSFFPWPRKKRITRVSNEILKNLRISVQRNSRSA